MLAVIKELHYWSQLTAFDSLGESARYIGPNACGITSLAIAISRLRHVSISPIDVLKEAVKLHKVNPRVINYWLKSGNNLYIPIGIKRDYGNIPRKLITNQTPSRSMASDGKYRGLFSLERGLHWKHLDKLTQNWGISTNFIKFSQNESSISDLLDNNKVFLASIKNCRAPWMNSDKTSWKESDSHVVAIVKKFSFDKKMHLVIADPFSTEGTVPYYLPRSEDDFLNSEFNKRGALLTLN